MGVQRFMRTVRNLSLSVLAALFLVAGLPHFGHAGFRAGEEESMRATGIPGERPLPFKGKGKAKDRYKTGEILVKYKDGIQQEKK